MRHHQWDHSCQQGSLMREPLSPMRSSHQEKSSMRSLVPMSTNETVTPMRKPRINESHPTNERHSMRESLWSTRDPPMRETLANEREPLFQEKRNERETLNERVTHQRGTQWEPLSPTRLQWESHSSTREPLPPMRHWMRGPLSPMRSSNERSSMREPLSPTGSSNERHSMRATPTNERGSNVRATLTNETPPMRHHRWDTGTHESHYHQQETLDERATLTERHHQWDTGTHERHYHQQETLDERAKLTNERHYQRERLQCETLPTWEAPMKDTQWESHSHQWCSNKRAALTNEAPGESHSHQRDSPMRAQWESHPHQWNTNEVSTLLNNAPMKDHQLLLERRRKCGWQRD